MATANHHAIQHMNLREVRQALALAEINLAAVKPEYQENVKLVLAELKQREKDIWAQIEKLTGGAR